MTSTLSLAVRLGELDDDALHAAIVSRAVSPARINDLFDLAEALLDAATVQKALATLDRPTLAVLAAIAASDAPATVDEIAETLAVWGATRDSEVPARAERLDDLLLVQRADDRFAAYEGVRDRLAAWPDEGLPSGPQLAGDAPPTALAPVPFAEPRFVEQLSSEHAFTTVGAVAELVSELAREPAKELQKGGVALPDTRRLATAMGIDDARVSIVLWLAERAALALRDGSVWLATDAAANWSPLSSRDRWARLASAWLTAMPSDVRELLAARAHADWDDSLRAFAAWLYPAAQQAMTQRLNVFGDAAEILGVTVRNGPTRAGVALLEDGVEAAADLMAALFPAEVDRVYLQHDLTIVSPGPLAPAVDTRLRSFADVESRALASSYRISSGSITRAIAAGESAASLRDFLESISLTGIPQPVEYLIAETASRYGRVRVSAVAESGASPVRSRVRSADAALLDAIGIDQALTSLGLSRTSPDELVSRFERDVVFWALSDARYPAAAEDAQGRVVGLQRRRTAPQLPKRSDDPIAALVARLRESESPDSAATAQAWLSRQLDIAIRARSTLIVSVALPDGRSLEYLLEPTGVGGGRLRGRDRTADIERTVPLSSITGIRTP